MKISAAFQTGWSEPIPYEEPEPRQKDESKEAYLLRVWEHKKAYFPGQEVRGFVTAEDAWLDKICLF